MKTQLDRQQQVNARHTNFSWIKCFFSRVRGDFCWRCCQIPGASRGTLIPVSPASANSSSYFIISPPSCFLFFFQRIWDLMRPSSCLTSAAAKWEQHHSVSRFGFSNRRASALCGEFVHVTGWKRDPSVRLRGNDDAVTVYWKTLFMNFIWNIFFFCSLKHTLALIHQLQE